MGLEIEGFDLLLKDMNRLVESGNSSAVDSALTKGAELILERAKQNIHSVTGALRSEVKITIKRKGGRVAAHIGVLKGSKAFYAGHVEFGHGGPHPAPAHPFLRPAYDAEVENAFALIKQELAKAIDKTGE